MKTKTLVNRANGRICEEVIPTPEMHLLDDMAVIIENGRLMLISRSHPEGNAVELDSIDDLLSFPKRSRKFAKFLYRDDMKRVTFHNEYTGKTWQVVEPTSEVKLPFNAVMVIEEDGEPQLISKAGAYALTTQGTIEVYDPNLKI